MSSSCDVGVSRGRVLVGRSGRAATSTGEALASAFDRDLIGSRTEQMEAVDEAREEGRLAGYVVGRQEGTEIGRAIERDIHERARERAFDAVSRLCDAVDRASAAQVAAIDALESVALTLAVEIAEAVIGRELEVGGAAVTRLAAERSLALVPPRADAVLSLHPDDLALIGDLDDLLVGRQLVVVADDRVERGGAVVTFGAGSVRAVPSEALSRVRDVLASTTTSAATTEQATAEQATAEQAIGALPW